MRRSRELIVYIGLVLIALAPGLVVLSGGDGGASAPWLKPVAEEMRRIAFGHGWRFWMGVTGAAAMAMLLLYPLRKLIGLGGILSVAAWFRLHIALGLAGPVLVLYHCNFGLGSTPANVALFTAMAVALSGFVGHFVHQRSTARFHDEAAEARLASERVRAEVGRWCEEGAKAAYLAELAKLDRPVSDARRTIVSGLLTLRRLRRRRRQLLHLAYAVIEREASGAAERKARKIHFRDALAAYALVLRRSARASVRERLLVGWRMLHLPLFAVTVVAASMHVVKVWDIDAPSEEVKTAGTTTAVAKTTPVVLPPRPSLVRETITPRPAAAMNQGPDPTPVAPQPPPPRTARPAPVAPAIPPVPPRPAATQSAPPLPAPAAPPPPRLAQAAEPELPPSRLGMPIERPAPKTAPAPTKDDPIERLRKLMAAETRGQFEPSALARRLGDLKNANFDHGKTMFPLTGRHATVSCESCHKTTLKDTPRDCIACHRGDDIHRGRRPDCARCHVTSDWATIKRRK